MPPAAAFGQSSSASSPAAALVARRPLVIAHRGDSGAFPENTLPAFRSAVAVGADLVELDYYHSSDGVPVVFHDKTLKRTTNALLALGRDAPIGSLTAAELRLLDAGSWKGDRFTGVRIPTLAESLDVIQAGSVTLIEHKQGDAQTCVELLRRKQLVDRVVVQSFNWEFLADCHRLEPSLVLGALGGKELTTEKLDQIEATGARVVGWSHADIGAEQIAAIHARGWKSWVYTVNEPGRARELIEAGLDGVITDQPALMIAETRAAGQ